MNDADQVIDIADSGSLAPTDKPALSADIPDKPASFGKKAGSMPRFSIEFVDTAWNEKKLVAYAHTGFPGIKLPIVDAYRTMCLAPSREVGAVFTRSKEFQTF